jgi:hypothetical protein
MKAVTKPKAVGEASAAMKKYVAMLKGEIIGSVGGGGGGGGGLPAPPTPPALHLHLHSFTHGVTGESAGPRNSSRKSSAKWPGVWRKWRRRNHQWRSCIIWRGVIL